MASEAVDEQPSAPSELSAEERERRDAALANVRQLGDPVLRTRALDVAQFDAQLREQVDRMRDVMDGALGVGLAATQVGLVQRMLVYRVEEESPIVALINPQIQWRGDQLETAEEGWEHILHEHAELALYRDEIIATVRAPGHRILAPDGSVTTA